MGRQNPQGKRPKQIGRESRVLYRGNRNPTGVHWTETEEPWSRTHPESFTVSDGGSRGRGVVVVPPCFKNPWTLGGRTEGPETVRCGVTMVVCTTARVEILLNRTFLGLVVSGVHPR